MIFGLENNVLIVKLNKRKNRERIQSLTILSVKVAYLDMHNKNERKCPKINNSKKKKNNNNSYSWVNGHI